MNMCTELWCDRGLLRGDSKPGSLCSLRRLLASEQTKRAGLTSGSTGAGDCRGCELCHQRL